MQKEVFVFDLDDTLYDCNKGLENAVTEKMIKRLAELRQCSIEEVRAKRLELFRRYNTRFTLLAFYYEGTIKDIEKFIKETYLSVDPRGLGIQFDPQLRKTLEDLKAPLYLHTNNIAALSERILDVLGVKDLFVKIYGMFENDCYQKPDVRAFQNLLKDVSRYRQKWYIDNEIPNLIIAKRFGFKTVLVNKEPISPRFGVDKQIRSVIDLNL